MKTLKIIIKEADKVFNNVIREHFQIEDSHKEFDYSDAVILGLLENLINHSKSMVILLEQKHYSSLDTILRIIFENYTYLKFILQKDTQLRSKAYACSTKIKEIQLMNNLIEDSLDGYKLRDFLGVKKEEVVEKLSRGLDKKYQASTFNVYLNEIGMKRIEQKWYNLNGDTKNLKILCSKLNLSVEYNLIYSILSTETHAKDAIRNFLFEENQIGIINGINNEELHVSMAGLYLIESVRVIYKYYNLKKQLKSFNILTALNYKSSHKV